MKKIVTLIALAFAACNNNHSEIEKNVHDEPMADSTNMNVAKTNILDTSKIQFASNFDTTCGMPVRAGVQDTLILHGKVYGFCAKECKEEFIKTLKARHIR